MSKVALNTAAPDFTLQDYQGNLVSLSHPMHKVLRQYGQEIRLFKFGRMPAQVMVDKSGIARYVHYGNSMSDIPPNDELLSLADELNQEVPVPSA